MNTRRILHILILTSIILALIVAVPSEMITAQSFSPSFSVFIEFNHIVGFHWPVGTSLTLTIDDPAVPGLVDYIDTVTVQVDPNNPDSTEGRFELGEAFQIEPGHFVTISGGGATKTHTVTSLTRTGVDMPGDRLLGSAVPGSMVEVKSRWQKEIIRRETANTSGYWEANFSVPGDAQDENLLYDFTLGTEMMIIQNDDYGDKTQVDFRMPFPTIDIQLTQNAISWRDWPSGYPVEITFNDPTTIENPDDGFTIDPDMPYPSEHNCGCLPIENYRLRPGHIVTMDNGFLTKTQVLPALQVTDFDYDLDTIAGTAEPNSEVFVETQFGIRRRVMANDAGDWLAYFSIPGDQEDEQEVTDLVPWDEGIARVSDDDYDSTEVTWPFELGVSVGDEIHATNWYAGDEVTLRIDDPATPGAEDFTASAFPVVGPWAYAGINFNIGDEFRTQPGHIVSLSQIDHSKTCIVSPIQINGMDYITDIVTGTSNAYDLIQVFAPLGSGDEWARYRYTQADSNGHWGVDFSQPGTHIIRHPDEIEIVDIFPYQSISASVGDDHACFTSIWTIVAMPVIRVRLTAGEIYAQNYVPGYPVTLEVFQPGDLFNPVYSDTKVMGADNLIIFDYHGSLNIGPGYLVRASDSVVTKEHTVTGVWIDDVDRNLDDVYGIAEAGTPVTAVARSDSVRAQRDLIATGGAWMADFSVPGSQPWEQDIIDLDTAYIIFAYQMDGDNDMTWVHWLFNQPPVVGEISGVAAPMPVNSLVQVSASFSDPDMGDMHTAVWEWGDGTTSTGVVDEANGTASGSHIYTEAGVYTLHLSLRDAAEACAETTYQYLVVYDPAGGFVTGGGWIWSPVGAYATDPALEGKATFGFVSKYKKGVIVPEGNTEFQFHAGDLNFKSTLYEWLVVAGSKPQFKGSGTINGAGSYKFMVYATDGSPDKFRIKIWDAVSGVVVYDNGAEQTLGGGSIVVHK